LTVPEFERLLVSSLDEDERSYIKGREEVSMKRIVLVGYMH